MTDEKKDWEEKICKACGKCGGRWERDCELQDVIYFELAAAEERGRKEGEAKWMEAMRQHVSTDIKNTLETCENIEDFARELERAVEARVHEKYKSLVGAIEMAFKEADFLPDNRFVREIERFVVELKTCV